MTAILVTGGAGFIGSNFVRHYLDKHKDDKVVNLDKLTYAGNVASLYDVMENERHVFCRGDIADKELVRGLIRRHAVSRIVHFAAESHVDNSIKDPGIFFRTNVLGTQALLEAARKESIERFLHVSTDEVYGDVRSGFSDESWPLLPNSPYSASKAGSDLLVRSYVKTYGFPAIITRSSNNFGPYQFPEKLIPLFVTNLLDGKKVPVYGSGNNMRDWIYVKDNCSAIDHLLAHGKVGEVYNIGGGNVKTNLEITEMILRLCGASSDSIEFVRDRPGHDFRYAIDCSRARSAGWKPMYDFESALAETVDWYSKNDHWWRPLKK